MSADWCLQSITAQQWLKSLRDSRRIVRQSRECEPRPSSHDNNRYITRHSSWEHSEVTVTPSASSSSPITSHRPRAAGLPGCPAPDTLNPWHHTPAEQVQAFHDTVQHVHRYGREIRCLLKFACKLEPLKLLTPFPMQKNPTNWIWLSHEGQEELSAETESIRFINKPYTSQGDEADWRHFAQPPLKHIFCEFIGRYLEDICFTVKGVSKSVKTTCQQLELWEIMADPLIERC